MPISHYRDSVERMLAFKGVSVRTKRVPYDDKRELLAATGQESVPTLVWDGKVMRWHDIPDFLETRVPEPTLYPWGNKGLAVTLENWGHNVLEERIWRYVVTNVPPVLADDHERWVFEEMQTRTRAPWHVLLARRREFREDMMTHPGMVDAMLADRDWVLGEPRLADFGIYGGMSPLLTVGETIPKGFPACAPGRVGSGPSAAAPHDPRR